MVPVRLTQIKVEVRIRAAQQVGRKEPTERTRLLIAALQPSDTTYYLSEKARPLLRRYAA